MYAGQVKRERASVGKLSAVHCQWKACLSGRPTFLNKQKRKWVPFLFVTQQEWDCAERGAAGWKKSRKARVSRPLFELLPPRLFLRDRLFQSLPHPSLCRFLWTCCLIHCPFIPVSAAPGRQNEVTEPAWGSRIHTGWLRDPMRGLLIEQKVLQHVVIALMFVWSSVTPWNL